jgi:hypothetical protein
MTSQSLDRFLNAIPTEWQMDLTPPQGEWDEELQLLPFQEAMAGMFAHVSAPFVQLGKQFGRIFGAAQHQAVLDEYASAIKAVSDAYAILEEQDNELHGLHLNHTHISLAKKNQSLPRRKANSGPAWNPHARGGRGARR